MSNEAAERLREWIREFASFPRPFDLIDAALAEERKATVQRIEDAFRHIADSLPNEDFRGVYAILDAEAAR